MAKTATFGVMHVITAFSVTYAMTGSITIAGVVTMVPEGLVLLTSIAMAVDLTRTRSDHSGFHADTSFGSVGRGGCTRFSSLP